jgi:hypothetical protein
VHGDAREPLPPVGAVQVGRLVQLRVDPLQAGHEHHHGIADLDPDHDRHHAEQRVARVTQPVARQRVQVHRAQDGVQRPVARVQDPPPDDAGHRHRQDLRQVQPRAEQAGGAVAEPLGQIVEQHRGQQQPDQRRHHRHRHDQQRDVLEGRPEVGVVQQAGVVRQADPPGRADPRPPGEAQADGHEQRHHDDAQGQQGAGDEEDQIAAAGRRPPAPARADPPVGGGRGAGRSSRRRPDPRSARLPRPDPTHLPRSARLSS